jgi:hypothetical protein
MNVTATISDQVLSKLRDAAETTVRVSAAVLFGLSVGISDGAAISDEVIEASRNAPVTDSARIWDEVFAGRYLSNEVTDGAAISGVVIEAALGNVAVDEAFISETVVESFGFIVTDSAIASDEVQSLRIAKQSVIDTARISDFANQAASVLVEDSALVSDTVAQFAAVRLLVADSAQASDEIIEAIAQIQVVTDSASVSDALTDSLDARQLVIDSVTVYDEVLQQGSGQAWTADAGSWAMSHYAPFTAQSLVVIDGVFYAAMRDGVYALDGENETIACSIQTGRMAMGDAKATPRYGYIEYELAGNASMTVTQSGAGAAQESFTYPLVARDANTDTSGRFVFGKGLRDKRFAFRLDVQGTRCEVYGLSIDVASLQRKI